MALKNENRVVRIVAHFVLCIAAILAIAPFVLLLSASLTSSEANATHGFTFIPTDVNFAAYKYIFKAWDTISKAYLMTIIVTVVGTVLSVLVTMLMAFALSWNETPFKGIITVLLIFSMLFNGGAIATYIVYSNIFHINNTIFAYIIPGIFMNAFSVILFKNYFKNTISTSLMDAAMLDGANMFTIFSKIYLPLSKPIIATLGLMQAIGYWNDWNNGLYYIDDSKLYTVQMLLRDMQQSADFLSSNPNVGSITVDIPSAAVQMAVAVIGILPIIVAYPFFQKHFIAGLGLGGVKE